MRTLRPAKSLAALAIVCLGCRDHRSFDAPLPIAAVLTMAEPVPPVAPSRLEVPVRYDLTSALAWLEQEVPRTIGSLDERIALPDNDRVHIAYVITRNPFRVTFRGQTATVSSVVHYEGKGWYNPPLLPEVSASCGTGDSRPRARLTLRMTVGVTDQWMLRPKGTVSATALTDTERDQCQVTVLKIDVTDKVLAAAEDALQKEVDKIERRLRAFPLRSEVGKVWADMQSPLRLSDSLWLLINPVSVRFQPPTVVDRVVQVQAGLDATPVVEGGPKPPPAMRPLLPPNRSPPPPPMLIIRSEGRLPYDVGGAILSDALRGKTIDVAGRTLVVQRLRPIPMGDGRLAIGLTVSGAAEGTLYAVGHPQIDSAGRLTMPDLTIDPGTMGVLTGALAWLASTDAVQAFLREAIAVDLGPTINEGRLLAQKNMNRELAPGVRLRTTLPTATPVGVWAGPEAIIARVVVTGEGAIDLELDPRDTPPTDTVP